MFKSFLQFLAEDNKIANTDIYLSNMAKTFSDKAWFLQWLPKEIDTIVDFGGGEGEFAEYIQNSSDRKFNFIIIDNNKAFLRNAEKKGFQGFTSLDDLLKLKEKSYDPKKTVIILSSVIHEIYSYADPFYDDPGVFWYNLKKCNFKAVAIRDMTYSPSISNKAPIDAILWIYKNVFKSQNIKIKNKRSIGDLLTSFEDTWGAICDPDTKQIDFKRLFHFLIKYRYVENWDRELNEDYLPISQNKLDEWLQKKLGYKYDKKLVTHLPFYSKIWRKDFKLKRSDNNRYMEQFATWLDTLNTHIKILGVK